MRINFEPARPSTGRGPVRRYADAGIDEAYFDAFAMFTSLDRLLDFAGQVIERTGRL